MSKALTQEAFMEDFESNVSQYRNVGKKSHSFEPNGFNGMVYSMVHDVVCVLAFVVIVFVLAARLVGVSGSSMYPTLVGANQNQGTTGDYLVLRSNFLCGSYKQGDIVVACVPTHENGKPIVKRVIATAGQTIVFQIGTDTCMHVYVDDVKQTEDFLNESMTFDLSLDGYSVTVPEGCYFLMGDNRNQSLDSRSPDIGMVDGRYIVGKALWLVFPGQDTEQNKARSWKRIGDIYG